MKRKLLWCLALTGLLVTTSCSQDETVDEPTPQRHAIGFSSFIDKPTRADVAEINNDNFDAFQVWAYETPAGETAGNFILYNAGILKKNGAWGYEYDSQKAYWRPGSKFRFFAVGPSSYVNKTDDQVSESDGNNIIGVNLTTADPANPMITFVNRVGTIDLVAAINDEYASTAWAAGQNTAAELYFCHLLTRIHFSFENAMDDGSTLQISAVTINNSPKKGKASVTKQPGSNRTEATWLTAQAESALSTETTADLRFGGAAFTVNNELASDVFDNVSGSGLYIRNGKTAQTQSLLIIPINSAALTVSFTIKHKKGELITRYDKQNIAITPPEGGWKSGYCYELKARLTSKNVPNSTWEPITFDPEVVDWIEQPNNTLIVPDATTTPTPTPTPIRRR